VALSDIAGKEFQVEGATMPSVQCNRKGIQAVHCISLQLCALIPFPRPFRDPAKPTTTVVSVVLLFCIVYVHKAGLLCHVRSNIEVMKKN